MPNNQQVLKSWVFLFPSFHYVFQCSHWFCLQLFPSPYCFYTDSAVCSVYAEPMFRSTGAYSMKLLISVLTAQTGCVSLGVSMCSVLSLYQYLSFLIAHTCIMQHAGLQQCALLTCDSVTERSEDIRQIASSCLKSQMKKKLSGSGQ